MKNLIIVVFLIILAVFIGTTLIAGDDNSFKSGAEDAVDSAISEMNEITGIN